MSILNQLKIGQRLAVLATIGLLLLAGVTFVGIAKLAELDRATQEIVQVEWVKTRLAMVALDNARGSIARVFQAIGSEDKAHAAEARERLAANTREFDKALAELGGLIHSVEGHQLHARSLDSGKAYVAAYGKALEALARGDSGSANRLAFNETYESLHSFATSLRELNDYQQRRLEKQGAISAATYSEARNLMLVFGVLAMISAIGLSMVVSRSITKPIAQAVRIAETVASGDLRTRIQAHGRDEAAQLLGALQRMNDSLLGIVERVRSGSESVATGSSQIATGNLDLSQRTEEQASNLQQTAASMEQLTSTVTQNADNARAASQLAAGATEVAAKGGHVVDQVVSTMSEITSSSRRIADIIGVIDGIAFQTNILALNASVEAARAGVQGRGFAVVAAEVRHLAQRSARAAREIKGLIEQSVMKVDDGARLVEEAGRTMDDIVSQVRRVNDLVGEISQASIEQARGIEQVGQAVAQLDQVTQQNAALVEQSAAAADSMKQQADRLTESVSTFKLEGAHAAKFDGVEGATSPQ